MAAGQGRSQTHALAAAPLPGGTPRHTPTFKAFLLFPCSGKPHGLALGDQPGSQRPPANSCPAPASPADPGLSLGWGPAPSTRHRPSRGHSGSGCGWSLWDRVRQFWDVTSSLGGKKGVTSHQGAELSTGLSASPPGFPSC